MQYTILCVGKIKEKFYTDAVNEYKKRLSRYAKVDITDTAKGGRASAFQNKRFHVCDCT